MVTLAPSAEHCCWGVAYRLEKANAETILADLDVRERGGYVRMEIKLELDGQAPAQRVAGLTYQAWPGNRNYAGPAPLPEVAAQVVAAYGPSGANADYVLHLHAALNALGAQDPHVEALVARLEE